MKKPLERIKEIFALLIIGISLGFIGLWVNLRLEMPLYILIVPVIFFAYQLHYSSKEHIKVNDIGKIKNTTINEIRKEFHNLLKKSVKNSESENKELQTNMDLLFDNYTKLEVEIMVRRSNKSATYLTFLIFSISTFILVVISNMLKM